MAKMYETKRIIVARFSVRNTDHDMKMIHRGMKSIINLLTTEERYIKKKAKKIHKIIKMQSESITFI